MTAIKSQVSLARFRLFDIESLTIIISFIDINKNFTRQ